MPLLADIRDGGLSAAPSLLSIRSKPAFRSLASEIQTRLTALNLLDPPADGDFGPVSHWALNEFCTLSDIALTDLLTPAIAQALLAAQADTLLAPPADAGDLASKAISKMSSLGYWVCRHPDAINIVYVEGHNPDGSENDNAMDAFNDLRLAIRIRQGKAELTGCWAATTEPGLYWTLHPDPSITDPVKAAAHIALGQFKAWVVGMHKFTQEALVQREKIRIYRDANKDGRRTGDPVFEGAAYGIDQHNGGNAAKVGMYSAGCLVGQSVAGHAQFMNFVKSDPRYLANNAYRFMTAIIGQDQFDAAD